MIVNNPNDEFIKLLVDKNDSKSMIFSKQIDINMQTCTSWQYRVSQFCARRFMYLKM